MTTKIYVASSWRNQYQPEVVKRLRAEGFAVYDFRNPAPGDHGFHWSEIDPAWKDWSPEKYRDALRHPVAVDGFNKDMAALQDCDVCVLVLPCGRSAHLETGWASGSGKLVMALVPEPIEPELMYSMFKVFTSIDELIKEFRWLYEKPDPALKAK
jgi:hypothetical protein